MPSLYPLNAENAAQGGFGSPSATGLLQSGSLCPFCCLEPPGDGGQEELSPWEQQGLLVRRWCVRPSLLGWGNAVLLPVQHDLLLLGSAGYCLSSL